MAKAKLAGVSLKPMQQTERALNKQGNAIQRNVSRDVDAMVRRAMKQRK